MKNAVKLLAITAMTAVIGFSFTACPAPAAETTSGDTTEIYVGEADLYAVYKPVYRRANTDETKADEMISKIGGAYSDVSDANRAILTPKITKIVIVSGTAKSAVKSTGVIELGEDLDEAAILAFFTATASTFA
jgi:hypothetical protein